MKTGTKIFIGYWIVVALVILTSAIYFRFAGFKENGEAQLSPKKELTSGNINLPSLKAIKISNIQNFILRDSTENLLKFGYKISNKNPKVYYKISGDTLVIDSAGVDVKSIVIYCRESQMSFIVHNSKVLLRDTFFRGKEIFLDNSRLRKIHEPNIPLTIGVLNIQAVNNSDISLSNVRIDSLILNTDNSRSYFSGKTSNIKASFSNESELECESSLENMQLKKDKSSKVKLGRID